MGALSSVEHKSSSRKTHSADAVNEPRRNGLLVVVSPSETVSTPSSPNRDVSLLRSRSRLSDAGLPALAADADSRRENGFSPAELAIYCGADNQQRSQEDDEEEFQTRGDEPVTKSSDGTAPAVPSPTSNDTPPLEVFTVKPPLASTTSDSSSVAEEPTQRANGGGETRARPKLQEARARRSSEAITDIAQAKKVAHRTVVARTEKAYDPAGGCKATKAQQKPVQQKHAAAATTPPPNGAAAGELSERCTSPKSTNSQQSTRQSNSDSRPRELKQQSSSEEQRTRRQSDTSTQAKKPAQPVTVARSEKTPATAGDSKENPTRHREEKPVAKPATSKDERKQSQPEPDTGTAAPASDVSRKSTSTKAHKSASKKAHFSQPEVIVSTTAASNNDEDDDDDWDWENLISALRDPDDVRTRKTEPRRNSNWGKPAKPTQEKSTKDKTNTTEEDDDNKEKEEEANERDILSDDADPSRFRMY